MDNAYLLLFETFGGSFISLVAGISSGDVFTAPPPPTREGYTFGDWFTDEDCTRACDFADGIPGGITLYAKWIAVPVTGTQTQNVGDMSAATVRNAVDVTTTAAVTTAAAASCVVPTLTQAPALLFGSLAGLFVTGVLMR